MDAQRQPDDTDLHIERLARRRVGLRLGWATHALVYLAVNLGLGALALARGESWAVFPALGWGLGLTIHGLVVWLALGGGGWQQRWLEQERQRLRRDQGPR